MISGTATPMPAARRDASPLHADYRLLLELCPVLRLALLADGEPSPSRAQGWYSAAELAADPAALEAALAGEAARIAPVADEHGTAPRPHVAASRLLHHYLWSVSVLIAGPWHLARRVPVIDAADLWLHAPTGDLALRPRAHVSLPGDDELRAELRAAVVTHVEPLLAAFAGPTRRGTRALWGMVTDDLASAIWYLGRMLDERSGGSSQPGGPSQPAEAVDPAGSAGSAGVAGAVAAAEAVDPAGSAGVAGAVAAAEAVLPGGTEPLVGAAAFRTLLGADGRSHPTRTRLGCCLYYAIRPDSACITCPRTPDDERLKRL